MKGRFQQRSPCLHIIPVTVGPLQIGKQVAGAFIHDGIAVIRHGTGDAGRQKGFAQTGTANEQQIAFTEEPLKEGDHVRIIEGTLTGLEGIIVHNKNKRYFAIKVDLLGCAIMEIEDTMIQKIA